MRPPARPQRVAPVRADRAVRDRLGAGATPQQRSPAMPPVVPVRPSDDPPAEQVAEAGRGGATGADVGAAPTVVRGGSGWQPVRPAVVSTGSQARFAERAAMRRRLTEQRLAIAAAVVVLLTAAGWLLLVSPVLALDAAEVEIRGQGTVVDAAAVATVVQSHDGTPLPRLDTVSLRRAILDVPGVRAAEVARVWPHGLRITVVSREPVAAVPEADEGFALLDVEGVQVGRVEEAPEGLPVISVPLGDPDARAMTAVLTVLQQLPPELAAEVATAAAETQDTVTFGLRDGAVVEWGSADRNALKARVLQTLRAAEASRDADVFDVSAPELPITQS